MPPRHSTRFRKGQGVPRGSPGRRELQTDVSYQARLQVEDHARTTSIRPEGANVRCRSQIPVRDPPGQESVCSCSRCVWGFSPPLRSPVNAFSDEHRRAGVGNRGVLQRLSRGGSAAPRARRSPSGRAWSNGRRETARKRQPAGYSCGVCTISTSQCAWCDTASLTLAPNRRWTTPCSWPTTIMSAPRSSASCTIASAGSPTAPW